MWSPLIAGVPFHRMIDRAGVQHLQAERHFFLFRLLHQQLQPGDTVFGPFFERNLTAFWDLPDRAICNR